MKKFATMLISLFVSLLFSVSTLLAQKRVDSPHQAESVLGKLTIESFEGAVFPPEGWKKITNFAGAGWQQGATGSQVLGFDSTSVIDVLPAGGGFVAYASWATGDADTISATGQATDQWLITPQITDVQTGDTLKFYLKHFNSFGDKLDILISTAGDSTAAFDTLVTTLQFFGSGDNNWNAYSFALTDFVDIGADIFIAFREHVSNNFVDGDALFLDLVEVQSLVTSVENNTSSPHRFQLFQNYPNPFNPSTKISFTLPQSAEVTLKIYNVLGQEVFTLLDNAMFASGQHSVQLDADHLANGIYYYQIEAGDFLAVKKMTLLK